MEASTTERQTQLPNFYLSIQLWDGCNQSSLAVQYNAIKVRSSLKEIFTRVAECMPGWQSLDQEEAAMVFRGGRKYIRNITSDMINPFIELHCRDGEETLTFGEWKRFASLLSKELKATTGTNCVILLICDLSEK